MRTVKLRIEGDELVTDSGVRVGGIERDPIHGRYFCVLDAVINGVRDYHTTADRAEAAYNAHLQQVMGDYA